MSKFEVTPGQPVEARGSISRFFHRSPTFSAGEMKVMSGVGSDGSPQWVKFCGAIYCEVGEEIIVKGKWKIDPKYGAQIEVKTFQFDAALSSAGLVAMLAKDRRFKGVGPAGAEKIVRAIETMGGDFHDAMGKVPADQLAIAAGVKLEVIELLKEEWTKRGEMNLVMARLSAYDVAPGSAQRLFEEYGPSVVGVIQKDPYWLIGKVRGFAFKKVDAIALKAGVEKSHSSRLRHGINWLISEMTHREGSTFSFPKKLFEEAKTLLATNTKEEAEKLRDMIRQMVSEKSLVHVKHEGVDMLWSQKTFAAEQYIARTLTREGLRDHFTMCDAAGEDSVSLKDVEAMPERLNEKQSKAVLAACKHRVSVMTGGAGVGKTYTIKAICKLFDEYGASDISLCAPTGKAAKRMEESIDRPALTIHKLLNPVRSHTTDGVVFSFEYGEGNPLPCQVVIVDEMSMVDIHLFRSLLEAINFETTVLVMVGDHNQLPPVGPGAVLRDLMLTGRYCAVTVLDQIHRQAGLLKENVQRLLTGSVAPGHKGATKDGSVLAPWYVVNNYGTPGGVRSVLKSMLKTRLAANCLEIESPDGTFTNPIDPIWHVQVLSPMKKGDIGVDALNIMIQEIHQAQFGVSPKLTKGGYPRIHLHDKVICTKNNYKVDVMNGSMGRVTAVDKGSGTIIVEMEGLGERIFTGEDTKDLQLAYAMTVHKSQGSEYPVVIFICHRAHSIMHHRGLIYTAISRAQKSAIIIGDAYGIKQCAKSEKSNKRRTLMGLDTDAFAAAMAIKAQE